MDTAWDRLLDLVEELAADPGLPLDTDVENAFEALASDAITVGDIDSELHAADVARWLTGLVAAHHFVRTSHPDTEPDRDLGDLRRIVTRWLHPARPR